MAMKITKLDAPEGMFMNDIEVTGKTFAPNVGYLLYLMAENGALEGDKGIRFPLSTYITESVRVFTFEFDGAVCIFKVELSE